MRNGNHISVIKAVPVAENLFTSCTLRPFSQRTLGTHLGRTGALVQGTHRTGLPEQQVVKPQHHDVRAGGTTP